MDDSTKVAGIGNTQTVVYATCKAPNSKLEAVRDDCEDWWNRVSAAQRSAVPHPSGAEGRVNRPPPCRLFTLADVLAGRWGGGLSLCECSTS